MMHAGDGTKPVIFLHRGVFVPARKVETQWLPSQMHTQTHIISYIYDLHIYIYTFTTIHTIQYEVLEV